MPEPPFFHDPKYPSAEAAAEAVRAHQARRAEWDRAEREAKLRWRKAREPNGHDKPPRDDIPPVGDEAPAANGTAPPDALSFLDLPALVDVPVPERQWIDPGRVPAGTVSLLSGDGGTGKTGLTLQLAVSMQARREWLGAIPVQGPVIALLCEDDSDEIHRRLAGICAHYDVTLADLAHLHIRCLAGEDTVLAAPDRTGLVQPTALYEKLTRAAMAIHPSLVILDNAADVYAGSEIARELVRQFISLLRRLCAVASTTVLLTAHPSLSGMASGTGSSGSTAWSNSVRSRMYLRRPKANGDDEQPDVDARELEIMKSNYTRSGEVVSLQWRGGLFLPVGGSSPHWLDRQAAQNDADELFLKLLDRFNAQQRNVSHMKASRGYAPTEFAKEPEAIAKGIKKQAFEAAIPRLFAANKIRIDTYGRPSRPYTKLVCGAVP